MLFASSARAEGAPAYTLDGKQLVIENDEGRSTLDVPCDETHALAQRGRLLVVACGQQGTATFSLADPTHPTYVALDRTPCFEFGEDGSCTNPKPAPRVVMADPRAVPDVRDIEVPRSRGRHDVGMMNAGIGITIVGGGAFVTGVVVVTVGAMQNIDLCIFGCSNRHQGDTTMAVGGVMMLAGVLTAAIGIPFIVIGAKRTTTVAFGPGSMAVRF